MPASLFKRFEAYVLDVVLVYLFISLVISIKFINPNYDNYQETYTKYTEVIGAYNNKEINAEELNNQTKEILYNLSKYSVSTNVVAIVTLIGYFVIFQKFNKGQTLGKKIMKIRVTSTSDREISMGRYLLRILPMYFVLIGNILAVIVNSILPFILDSNSYMYSNTVITYLFIGLNIISLVMVIVNKDKKGLHDYIAKTQVISE